MNKLENRIRKYAKKLKAINYLGGKCEKCNETNLFKLTFHHLNPNEKELRFGNDINRRWSKLKIELDKCQLLCQNCHREVHYEFGKKEERRVDKNIYLEYAGSKCIECGYDKCPSSLTFHHKDPSKKEFWIGGLSERINSVYELSEKIKNEIDKCDLLCMNCHVMKHVDINFFNENIGLIVDKSEGIRKIKEIQSKINREEVYKMYDSGIKQIEIARYFNASNGTISDILKPYKKLK